MEEDQGAGAVIGSVSNGFKLLFPFSDLHKLFWWNDRSKTKFQNV